MKYGYFMKYIPLMLVCSFITVQLADYYGRSATAVSYGANTTELGEYDGDELLEYEEAYDDSHADDKTYNGREIKDNGLPYCIKVNKKTNVVTIYTSGKDGYYDRPVKAMICSVGEADNTPEGMFRLGDRSRWLPLQGDVYGQYATRITGNILFHSVPYYSENADDLEVEEYNKLGESVSAGCVRLAVIDAKWIYDNCGQDTQVEIFSSEYAGPMGKPAFTAITKGNKNWDPTDIDEENPYIKNLPIIIGANDREIDRYTDFDITAGVTAIDEDGKDITDRIKIDGQVDANTCGSYTINYSVKNKEGKEAFASASITIKDDECPVLQVDQKVFSICADDAVTNERLLQVLRKNVTAIDGTVELSQEHILVDFSEITAKKYGACHVKYRAEDSEGNRSEIIDLVVDVDIEVPTLELKKGTSLILDSEKAKDDQYLLSLVDVVDNSGKADVRVSKPLMFQSGEAYKVMYTAKDMAGNISTLSVEFQIK